MTQPLLLIASTVKLAFVRLRLEAGEHGWALQRKSCENSDLVPEAMEALAEHLSLSVHLASARVD
jgi:hypothetical protein